MPLLSTRGAALARGFGFGAAPTSLSAEYLVVAGGAGGGGDLSGSGGGFTYDAQRDAFISPKPFASWTLNETTCQWESPIPYPTDGKIYQWDEATTSWVEV